MKTILLRDGTKLTLDGGSGVASKDNKHLAIAPVLARAINDAVFDAEAGIFFQRELEKIKARSYDVQYADLKARELFPVSNEGGRGIERITYRTYDQVGAAKIINAYAKDLPRVDVSGKETSIPVRSVADAYGYNIDEIESSQLSGKNLDARRGEAAMRAIEQVINTIGFFGSAADGLPGFFDNPNIPTGTVVNPGGGTEWVNKTPDEILFDLNDGAADIFEATLMIERPNTVLLPPAQWQLIHATPRSVNSDTTIAEFFARNNQFGITKESMIPVNECTAALNPLYSNDVMAFYDRSPEKLEFEIPLEAETLPIQPEGLEFVIPVRARVGGLNVYYPLSANILEGI